MDNELKVLCLEDSLKDTELIRELLVDSGYKLIMDSTALENEFISFLRSERYDIILSDFKLPGFDAFAALVWAVEICPDVPFICVSGTVGEETAIDLLRKGAVDYILKDRLIRLPSAIRRAIEESKEKKARVKAETALYESEERFRTLFENSTVGIYRTTPEGKILLANPALVKSLGFSSFKELSIRNLEEDGFEPSYERSHFTEILNREGVVKGLEAAWTRADGTKLYVSESAKAIRDKSGKILYFDGIVEDITIRKLAEEKINQQYYTLKCITESSGGPFFSLDKAYKYTSFNKAHATVMKLIYNANIELGVSLFEYQRVEEDKIKAKSNLDRALTGEFVEEKAWSGKDIGKLRLFEVTHNPIFNEEKEVIGVVVNARDITERERIEVKLKESEELYGKLFQNMLNGFAYCKMLFDKGRPDDFIYLSVNNAFEKQTGLKNVEGKKASEVIPGIQKSDADLFERYGRVALSGNPEIFEIYVKSLRMWFSISVYSPQKEYFVAVFDVITERKTAEEHLRETNEYLSNLFNYANAPIIVWDNSLIITQFNHAFERLSGYFEEEVLGKKIDILFSKDKAESSLELIKRAVSGERWETVEIEIQKKDGNSRIVLWNSANILDKDGKTVMATIAQGNDITTRKKAEEALRQSEKLYRAIGESIDYGVWVCDTEGRNLYASDSFLKMVGITQEQCSNFGWGDVLHPDDAEQTIKEWKECVSKGKDWNREHRFHGVDGDWHYILARGVPVKDDNGEILSWAGINLDISDLKLAEKAVRESEDKFKYIFDHSVIGKSITYPDGKLNANSAFCNMLGYSPDEMKKMRWQDISHPDDIKLTEDIINSLISGEKKWARFTKRYINKNGSVIWTDVGTSLRCDDKGNPLYFMTAAIDITERKKAEEDLQNERNLLRTLIDLLPSHIFVKDSESRFLIANSACASFMGASSPQELLGKTDYEFYDMDVAHGFKSDEIGVLAGKPIIDKEEGSFSPTGSPRNLLTTKVPLKDSKGNIVGLVGTCFDYTERKSAEDSLRIKNFVFDASIAANSISDVKGKITEVNDAFLKIWGYDDKLKVLGKPISEFLKNPDEAIKIVNSLNSMGEWEGEYTARRLDQSEFIAHGLATVVKDETDKIVGYQSSVLDATGRIRNEKLLSNQKRIGDLFLTSEGDEMYFEVLKIILDLMQSPYGVFGFIDEEGALVVPTMTRHIWDKCNIPEKTFKFPLNTWGNSSWPRAIKEKKANYSNEISSMTPEGHVVLKRHISFPILFHGEVIGLFQLANKETDYMEEDMSTLGAIATYIAPILSARLLRDRAQKRLLSISNRQEAILSSVPDIIMEVDKNKVYTWSNRSGYDFFGDDVIGKEASFYFEGDQETYKAVQPLFKGSEGNIYIESWQRRKDGQKRRLAWWCRVLKDEDGNVTGALSSALDITEQKAAEQEIRKLNEDLELRVIQRTEQLEASNKELEAFSYSVSHDLRSPLRAIHSFTNILLEDYEKTLDDEGKRICGIISSSATQMGELIDDLLNFSRIGRSTMNPSKLEMKYIAGSVFDEISNETERKKIKLSIGKLQKAFGDPGLIRHVWNNLISNAIKYSSKNPSIEIVISSRREDDKIIYSIKDNGVGFDMKYKHKLFGVFQRLHSESEFEGNGVGLAIVQRIVSRHGGKVWAEGEVGQGATFYFSLPVDGDRPLATGNRKSKKT